MVKLQQTREEVYNNTKKIQDNIKRINDRRVKEDDFQLKDLVLKWDARNEEKGKHGKVDSLWRGPYNIGAFHATNIFLLEIFRIGGVEVVRCRVRPTHL